MNLSVGTAHREQDTALALEAPKGLAARCPGGAEHPFLDTSLFLPQLPATV